MLTAFLQVLNVEVPFYFKSIVDSMNVDFAALGGTAYTVAGTMILACKDRLVDWNSPCLTSTLRWCD